MIYRYLQFWHENQYKPGKLLTFLYYAKKSSDTDLAIFIKK